MDLFEYQAKELFAEYGVPVPVGEVAHTPKEARMIAERFAGQGVPRVVVKAQVKTGGRGKAGGVQLAEDPADAEAKAERILGMDIRGHLVRKVLVEQASAIAEEYYFSFLLDRANRAFLAICSAEGGVDIEEVAASKPEAVAKVPVSALAGVDLETARDIAAACLPEAVLEPAAQVIEKLWQVFVAEDATLVEVNPLIRTAGGQVVALDGKVTLDGNADFRHPAHARFADISATDPLEVEAEKKGLNYVKLDGSVGIIGNGAGLVMSTLDVVAYAGEGLDGGVRPANFLDIGGGASAGVMANGLEIVLSDPDVKTVFINVFGGITSCIEVANGIVTALRLLAERGEPVTVPLVVRLDGNSAAEGRRMLAEANIAVVQQVDTMDDAARRAAELAASR